MIIARVILADEISPDGCRLWDMKTNEKLDKDRFRRDLGGEAEAYQEVARRLGLLPRRRGNRGARPRQPPQEAGQVISPFECSSARNLTNIDEMQSPDGSAPSGEPAIGPMLAARFKAFGANTKHSIFQLVTTGMAFVALLVVMAVASRGHYWLTLLLAVPTAGLLVRLFIIQHDCGHGSFFALRRRTTGSAALSAC